MLSWVKIFINILVFSSFYFLIMFQYYRGGARKVRLIWISLSDNHIIYKRSNFIIFKWDLFSYIILKLWFLDLSLWYYFFPSYKGNWRGLRGVFNMEQKNFNLLIFDWSKFLKNDYFKRSSILKMKKMNSLIKTKFHI